MNTDSLQMRFNFWKYILFMVLGASTVLLLQAILIYQESRMLLFPTSWYGAWFLVQFAAFLPGFVLLWGKHWMKLPLQDRLNTIFGYFAVAWFTFLPVGIRVDPYTSKTFNFVLLGGAIGLATAYWWLRRRSNEIFV